CPPGRGNSSDTSLTWCRYRSSRSTTARELRASAGALPTHAAWLAGSTSPERKRLPCLPHRPPPAGATADRGLGYRSNLPRIQSKVHSQLPAQSRESRAAHPEADCVESLEPAPAPSPCAASPATRDAGAH